MGGTDNVYRNSYNVYQSCADGNMDDWIYTYSGDSCRIDTGTVQNTSGKNNVVDVSLPIARSVAAEMHTIGRQATETTDSANSQLNENMGGNNDVGEYFADDSRPVFYNLLDRVCACSGVYGYATRVGRNAAVFEVNKIATASTAFLPWNSACFSPEAD